MGILVPAYNKTTSVPGSPPTTTVLNNVYISFRNENVVCTHNADGTYSIHGLFRAYNSQNDIYCIDRQPVMLQLTKDQMNAPIHTILYGYLKSQYSGSTDLQ